MKHFFFPYDSSSYKNGMLNSLFIKLSNEKKQMDENLKVLYDSADIIYDKRLEEKDDELKTLIQGNTKKNTDEKAEISFYDSLESYRSNEMTQYYRIESLEMLWRYIEEDSSFSHLRNQKEAEDNTEIQVSKVLYHLAKGNICLRISQCYYEKYDLKNSEIWGNRVIEILWHGKHLASTLRDSLPPNEKLQMDLYLRLLKLNIAKYYRDYARKNRRSDFYAALDEFKLVTERVEEEIEKIRNEKFIIEKSDAEKTRIENIKRQYALIWMDAIFNIAKVHRRIHSPANSMKEVLFCYNCLQAVEESSQDKSSCLFSDLIKNADNLAKKEDYENLLKKSEIKMALPKLDTNSFEKFCFLKDYDKQRYILLLLIEISRVYRDLHFSNNYLRAMAMAIIADRWSCRMDKRDGYTPGHNIDALITFSSSLRKYVKFKEDYTKEDVLLQKLEVHINGITLPLDLNDVDKQNPEENDPLNRFINILLEFANNGHLKSKTEVIKWHCLYQQKRRVLQSIYNLVGTPEEINKLLETKSEKEPNIQLRFLNGLVLLRSKNYSEAITVLEKLVSPDNKETQYIRHGTIGLKARYLLANCYMSLTMFAKAEKILKELLDTLTIAQENKEQNSNGEIDVRIEVDLGYCYMQRGEYSEAIKIYRRLYVDDKKDKTKYCFRKPKTTPERINMGLNNYAACCIFALNDKQTSHNKSNKGSDDKFLKEDIKNKVETARKIFFFMEQNRAIKDLDPETSLLKGYYTLCVGKIPDNQTISDSQVEICSKITDPEHRYNKMQATIHAHKFFQEACRFDNAFAPQYNLLDENEEGNKARYRNEVERISCYIINLIKLYHIYSENKAQLNNCNTINNSEMISVGKLKITEQQLRYLTGSKLQLERFLLSFPTTYKISLKAAIALAEWLLEYEKHYPTEGLTDRLYRSFSHVTIYEERGAQVFNSLKDNKKFRLFTAVKRGKLLALLLAMYKPIKAIKEECCFNLKDKQSNPNLVHYTKIENLKKILSDEQDGEKIKPHFRIDNCGYMNDVFEGITFLKSIALVSKEIEKMEDHKHSDFVQKYFPQLSRSHEDMLPSGSNVYIGSLSVKKDSFSMWTIYAENETGCNITFGDDFFDINGDPCYPKALREYMLSKYSDKDYPLYIVQYIGSKFEEKYKEHDKTKDNDFEITDAQEHHQDCGTDAILYDHLFRFLEQIYRRWYQLESYLGDKEGEKENVIRAFAADRINEIRFLFKDADYEFEGEVRIIYTAATEDAIADIDTNTDVPCVYFNIDRELRNLTVQLGSRIEDATVNKYVTWLKQTKRVKKVELSRRNRYIK